MEKRAVELVLREFGYGDGYGYGDGSGDGSGDGYGYGDGSGDGYGYGSGYGDGYGYGYGDGGGGGDTRRQYFAALLGNLSCPLGSRLAFWRSHKDGCPSNGGDGLPRKTGMTESVEGPLKICTRNALHGTMAPEKWKGERWWIVALHEPVQEEGDKIASLKRTILKDLGKCPF